MREKNTKNINKTWVIYKHTNTINGFSYIGQTSCFNTANRWSRNGNKYKGNTVFWQAIQQFGWENFTHEILEANIPTLEKANERERYWIAYYHTWLGDPQCQGYNTMKGGNNNWYIASDKTREKMRQAKLGYHHSIEYNKQLSKSMGGKEIICIETQEVYYGINDAYRQTKIRHILECCQHKRQLAGGYHWSFVDDTAWQEHFKDFIGAGQHITKLAKRAVVCIETGEVFETVRAAMASYKGCITKVLSGERELAAGKHWRYLDDYNL